MLFEETPFRDELAEDEDMDEEEDDGVAVAVEDDEGEDEGGDDPASPILKLINLSWKWHYFSYMSYSSHFHVLLRKEIRRL